MYRVAIPVVLLGSVDLDLRSSPGWLADTVATYCPSRMVEHSKSKPTHPRCTNGIATVYHFNLSLEKGNLERASENPSRRG